MTLAYVSLLPPVFFASVVVVMLIAGLWARGARKRHLERRIALAVGFAYSIVFWGLICALTNVQRKLTVPAQWHFEQWGNRKIVVVDTGNGIGGFNVESPQLEQYLQSTKPARVQVTLTGHYDFGVLRAWGVAEQVDGIPVTTLVDGESPPPSARIRQPVR